MDEDVIVREIVKSLAFEIEATNQDNVLKWTSSNGTPLSVKVRVRNPDEPRLVQKGPFPIPRIGITAPDRLRLVSSDQTILSFNIYLDKEAQKQEEYKRSKLFQIFNIGGCLGTISDDDGPYLPSSSNQKAITHKSSSRSESAIIDTTHTVPPHNEPKKWPFGRCKPGGCLDPPFGEDKYQYAPSKEDRRTKLALEIRELEKKQAADRVNSTLTEKPHLKAGSKENYQQKLDTRRHEVEPKKEIDVLRGAIAESRRKSKEGSLQCGSSVHISIKDEVDSKNITDIYARKSRENSLVTYHIDTSSTESLYGPIPNPSIKSYNESQRQTYEYPESYFVPPKDVLRYKEEERRYSKEPSNYQIGVSGLQKENDITDKINAAKAVVVEHKSISQNARGSKDINMKKLKLTLTELQSNTVDVGQKLIEDNISSKRLASDSKETVSYIPTDFKNINDHSNGPDTRTEADFKTTAKNSMKEQEIVDFKFQKSKKLRSGNDDIANIEDNSNILMKESTIEKPDDIIHSNYEISKPLKLQASTLTDSNVDEFSEVVKKNGRTLDKTRVSYPNKESSNDQISASGKVKENDITDKSNLIKAGMVDYKPVTQNARRSKDINMQKIEPKSAEVKPNNIDFAQKGTKVKASSTRLASENKEHISYILTDSKNVDVHKNVPDKILRSGNVDIINIEANTDIPIKVRTTEKLGDIVLSGDETYKPIKSQASPLSDTNIDDSSEVVKTNGRTLDKTRVSYPNKESSNDQISASGKVKESDIVDNSNLIKAGMVDYKPISQNARRSKDINMQKIEPNSAEVKPNNIDFAQKGTKDKASPTRLASESKEPISYSLKDSKNVDDHKNVPDQILRSGNVDIANIEANTNIPIKERTTEKLDDIVLSSDETYKPIKLQASPLSDTNIDDSSEVVKTNGRTLDKTRVSYPNKESSNDQISASGKVKESDIVDNSNLIKAVMVDYKPISQNARRSKDINMQKIEPKSAEVKPNNIDFAQKGTKDKASPTRLVSESKEPISYSLKDSKNVDDQKNVPDQILRSVNVDIANIEANTNIPIKVRTTEKLDDIVLSSDETYQPIKSQASPLSDSNIDDFSEVVKTNGRTLDKTRVSYPNTESSNDQISASGKLKESDIIDKSNLIKARMVDYKPISQNARRSKDINKQKIEPKSAEVNPNNIDFAQKGTKDKASPTRLASESKEPISYSLKDFKNVDEHKNVPDQILRSGNVDIANIEANTNIPIKVRTTEKLEDIVLNSDETYKPIKSQASPLNDSNIDEFSEIVKTIGRTLDRTHVSYPNKESSNDQISASDKVKEKVFPEAVKTIMDKKPNTYTSATKEMQNNMLPSSTTTDLYSDTKITKDKPHKKPSLPESRSNVVKVAGSSYQDVSNVSSKVDQTLPKTDSHKKRKTDIYTAPSADIVTKKSSNQSGIVGSPYMKKEFNQDAQYEVNDLNIRLPRESKTIDHEALSSDKSVSGIPVQKLVVDPDQHTASKQNYESTKQLELNKVSNKQSISGYKNEEETVNNNDGKTTLYEKYKKQSQITKDKPNLKVSERDATINKLHPEVQRHETNVQNEKSKNLTPSRKSSYENKEFDVTSTHSIDFMPKHLRSKESNDEMDTLPKKQTSAILQKTPFIPRHDLDIHDDDINKSTQLKRQTFTIIGSDTSLPKQEEIEETPKDVKNIYSKATDNAKSVSPSQTHDKTDILDATSKKLNTKIQSNSSVAPPHRTTQESVNKNDFEITNMHKSVSKDQAHNKLETLNRSKKAPENIRDFIITDHQTDDLAKTPENNKDMPGNITDLRSIITSDRHGLLDDQNRDESDTKKTEAIKKYNNKFDDASSGSILDRRIPDLYSKDTDYDRASPSTQVSEKAEILSTGNKDLEKTPNGDSSIDSTLSQKHIRKSTKPPKFTGNVKSALPPENRYNGEVISSDRNTESDQFSLTSKNHNKTENVKKAQENIIFKEIITDSHESLSENIKYLHSKVTNFVQENERDLYAHVADDGELTQYMQNRDKLESLSITSKLMENKTYSSTSKDISNKSIPQNQNLFYSEDIDHDELVTVVPKSDGTEHLVKSFKEQEDKMKLKDVKYKDIDGKIFTELGINNSSPKLVPEIIPNIEQVTDDAKYIASDQFETDFIGTNRNQPQIKIPRENSKQSDVSDYYDNMKAPDEIEFTENIADRYSKLSNKPKNVSEKSTPDNGYLGLISEVLSNTSVKGEKEKIFTKPSIGREATLDNDRDLIQTNTRVSLDNGLLGDKFSHMTIPTMPAIHGSNIDFAPKLVDDVYNVPINTLKNTSISTFEINRDSIKKTMTEAFDNVEHMIDDYDQVKQQSNDYQTIIKKPIHKDRNVPFKSIISDISEKPIDYRSSKVPISLNHNMDLNMENFDTNPSVYIKGEEHNERTLPNLHVIKESGSQNDISYLDMSFYSYINDDNQRVVQTYSPPNEQQRGNDATVTVVKTLIRHGNEVRIPVDKENDLTLNIVDKHSRVCDSGSSIGSPTRYPHREHHIVDHAKNQDILTKNLALIYESGLIPLHNVIKDLTQQVNNLTAKQEILQELKSCAKRTKSLRLIPVVKRCGCKRI